MNRKRLKRLNSLLREVISDVIRKEVGNPKVSPLITVTEVKIANDLRHAEVMISVIGGKEERLATLNALETSAGYISIKAAQQVVLHYFPKLIFRLDEGADRQLRVDAVLKEIKKT
jgi:ribosome-binding factor A